LLDLGAVTAVFVTSGLSVVAVVVVVLAVLCFGTTGFST
jgi:hypothetical protein